MRKQFRQLFHTTLIFSLSLICLQNVTAQDSTRIRIAGIILKWIPRECELNYKRAEKLIREAASKGVKIVCTTESFLDGYAIRDNHLTLNELIQLAEPIPGGDYISSLQILADETNIYLIAGLTEREDDTLFNSSVLINPDGNIIGKYRKVFLFGEEKSIYTPGNSFPAYSTSLGKIGMMICYDRQKPDMIEKLCENGAEMVFCLAGGGYGSWNDEIVSQRSKEGNVPIIFVHPIEFLVTGPSGEILDRTLFGNQLDDNEKQTIGGIVRIYDLEF